MNRYDIVILGCGPAGDRAATHAARAGKKVAVVERAPVVGGNRVNLGTLPSKTLRETALHVLGLRRAKVHGIHASLPEELTVADFMFRERAVVQRELELVYDSLEKCRVQLFRGHGRFLDPRTVEVVGSDGQVRTRLTAEVFLIATGSRPHRPTDVTFDGETIFDSDTILSLPRIPRSLIVYGAGVIGVEYASIFAALGLEVTLVDTRERLFPYFDREIVDLLERELQKLGILVIHDETYSRIERLGMRVRCETRSGNTLEADALLYAAGRDGNTGDIGLEALGIEPDKYGLLKVDERFRTRHPHIYAVGDVIGYPALASTSMEQGRQAVRAAFGIEGTALRTELLPMAVYAIPELSQIGETEEALVTKGVDFVVGRARYDMNARGQIVGDTFGMLKLLFERATMRLVGVHVVGTSASELIHIGEAFLRTGATARDVAETLFNYPTLSDLYRVAALRGIAAGRELRPQPATALAPRLVGS